MHRRMHAKRVVGCARNHACTGVIVLLHRLAAHRYLVRREEVPVLAAADLQQQQGKKKKEKKRRMGEVHNARSNAVAIAGNIVVGGSNLDEEVERSVVVTPCLHAGVANPASVVARIIECEQPDLSHSLLAFSPATVNAQPTHVRTKGSAAKELNWKLS